MQSHLPRWVDVIISPLSELHDELLLLSAVCEWGPLVFQSGCKRLRWDSLIQTSNRLGVINLGRQPFWWLGRSFPGFLAEIYLIEHKSRELNVMPGSSLSGWRQHGCQTWPTLWSKMLPRARQPHCTPPNKLSSRQAHAGLIRAGYYRQNDSCEAGWWALCSQ